MSAERFPCVVDSFRCFERMCALVAVLFYSVPFCVLKLPSSGSVLPDSAAPRETRPSHPISSNLRQYLVEHFHG
jgi:hypothetical protein